MENNFSSQDFQFNLKRTQLGIQVLAGLIDAILMIALYFVLTFKFPSFFAEKYIDAIPNFFQVYILFAGYRLASFLLLNGTIGMLFCGIHLLNHEYKKLSILEKLAAGIFILINDVKYYDK